MPPILKTWATGLKNRLFMRTAYDPDYRRELDRIEWAARIYGDRIGKGGGAEGLWRSIAQYRCQCHARGTMTVLMANLFAAASLPVLVFWYLRPGRRAGGLKEPVGYLKINFHMAYAIPNMIRSEAIEHHPGGAYLLASDVKFILWLFLAERAIYPELLAKFLRWAAFARPALDRFQPRMLIQYCEFSAHSSLRKSFLNHLGIGLANVSHGEEVISTRNCFSSFDEYFAWEITPRSVHEAMHMAYGHLSRFNPCENLARKAAGEGPCVIGLLWPSVAGSDLARLVQEINRVADRFKVIVRPHPNPHYAAGFEHYKPLLNAEVSDAKREGIHEYIDRCTLVVGYLSAALLQAAFRGAGVLYIRNGFLENIQAYHPYYQKVPNADLGGLAATLLACQEGLGGPWDSEGGCHGSF